jgi:hypothetical protein
MAERIKWREIVDRARLGYLVKCEVCGKIMSQPHRSHLRGMTYKERLENGDEELRHFLETAGFDLEKERSIAILTYLAHERGGHSSFIVLKHIELWASKEDQDWMDEYGERKRFEHISKDLDSLDFGGNDI